MLDISKYSTDARLLARDPDGHMFDLDGWSPHRAEMMAEEAGITLTEEHWAVIYGLREHYRLCGPDENARKLSRFLEETFAEGAGRKHLYELFPGGPVRQASRIAGLPQPAGCTDRSFGSVQ